MHPLPVDQDARGIIDPVTGLTRFRLDRFAPSEAVARFVDRYWVASWDLPEDEPFTQRILSHPVVNVVFVGGQATVHGPTTRVTPRRLAGSGWALGVMFRPAGFRPFLGRPMNGIVDAALPLGEVFEDARFRQEDPERLIADVDRCLAARVPAERHPAEDTMAVVERVAADPTVVGVAPLARREGVGVRLLQRRFADHVGLGPKTVIRRYRLYEAAERARRGGAVDWSGVAAELGFSDQSHLTREFTSVLGITPAAYAARSGGGADSPPAARA
ncbi:AraC family transcriptional regulator [Nocardiopsis sp. Huas11]|uniref:helix-turn-helix transcriptional regulator n=1 Tax=Nocardiopsis sp. Huas11 TaxID=2183912 RepID=UPI000F2395C4|nr:helix-turn-helix transcriptional regulator [Nocardiopsis sp. Huas11]RKS07090.1 AraC family transcriptional regulator [Nocardiopsis sp. Huas11]